jgi:hypothetical protein
VYLPEVCIHIDHSGPYAKSLSGARYSQLSMDRGSGYLWAVRQKKKTEHYVSTPKIFIDSWALSSRKIQFFQTDGDGVFASAETRDMLESEKVRHEWSAPYDSNTNPFIERARRTIFEGVCTALIRSGAPARFWGEAECHKIYTMNILPTLHDPDEENSFCSRRMLLEGNRRPPDFEKLMAFGTAGTCYVPKERRQGGKEPAQRRSFHAVILGYAENMPAYRVWDLEAQCIKNVSYNFTICHEGYYPFRDKSLWPTDFSTDPEFFSPTVSGVMTIDEWKKFEFTAEESEEILLKSPDLLVSRPEPIMSKKIPTENFLEKIAAMVPALSSTSTSVSLPVLPSTSLSSPTPSLLDSGAMGTPPLPPSSKLRNFWQSLLEKQTGEKASILVKLCIPHPCANAITKIFNLDPDPLDYLDFGKNLFTSVDSSQKMLIPTDPFMKPIGIPPPATLREARLSPWWPEYKKAMQVEYEGHIENGTWELVERFTIPFGKNILRGKWVFDDKRDETGKIIKFKARFVAMGFMQKQGIDFEETFAGVVVGKSFRTMLIILNEDPSHEFEHWDVKMAFTQATLTEEIFMHQPENFVIGEDSICRLKKSLYGLKQAAKNWSEMLRAILVTSNFFIFKSDPCVYFQKDGGAWCLTSTHVDDIFCLYNKPGVKFRNILFSNLQKEVTIENLGPVSWALKTTIQRDRKAGIVKISQESFITELLEKHAIVSPTKTQLIPTFENSFCPQNVIETDLVVDEKLKKKFQSQIGALWWLTSISRPDIFYAVHRCSKMQNKPTKILGKCIEKILFYLSHTKKLGIVYSRKNTDVPTLSGFVDASFASPDENYFSRVGYFYLFRGNLVSWVSENPSRIMTSSTEAECRGLVHISKENLWHRKFQKELSLYEVKSPTIVFEDNNSSISLSTNLGTPHKRSKHFDIEFSFFKQSVELGEIFPVFISTDEQPADMLTKVLPTKKFVYFRDMVMGDEKSQYHFDS